MIAAYVNDIKSFMNLLLKGSVFDEFYTRSVNINTFVSFEISGKLDKGFFTLAEQELINRDFCFWKELKPYIFNIIKGNRLPKFIKIIFSLNNEDMESKFLDASALFLNITFQNNQIFISSGCSQKSFSLNKSLEMSWDEYIKIFLEENKIFVSTHT